MGSEEIKIYKGIYKTINMKKKRTFKAPNKPVKFIKCDEFTQTYNWQKTNKGLKTRRTK